MHTKTESQNVDSPHLGNTGQTQSLEGLLTNPTMVEDMESTNWNKAYNSMDNFLKSFGRNYDYKLNQPNTVELYTLDNNSLGESRSYTFDEVQTIRDGLYIEIASTDTRRYGTRYSFNQIHISGESEENGKDKDYIEITELNRDGEIVIGSKRTTIFPNGSTRTEQFEKGSIFQLRRPSFKPVHKDDEKFHADNVLRHLAELDLEKQSLIKEMYVTSQGKKYYSQLPDKIYTTLQPLTGLSRVV